LLDSLLQEINQYLLLSTNIEKRKCETGHQNPLRIPHAEDVQGCGIHPPFSILCGRTCKWFKQSAGVSSEYRVKG